MVHDHPRAVELRRPAALASPGPGIIEDLTAEGSAAAAPSSLSNPYVAHGAGVACQQTRTGATSSDTGSERTKASEDDVKQLS